ncbi:hypothetical protein Tco_0601233 [Tanacetum coccineum]
MVRTRLTELAVLRDCIGGMARVPPPACRSAAQLINLLLDGGWGVRMGRGLTTRMWFGCPLDAEGHLGWAPIMLDDYAPHGDSRSNQQGTRECDASGSNLRLHAMLEEQENVMGLISRQTCSGRNGRSRVDRDSDNQQLLKLIEKDVVSSVATVLSDLCVPGEWMLMHKLHTELMNTGKERAQVSLLFTWAPLITEA